VVRNWFFCCLTLPLIPRLPRVDLLFFCSSIFPASFFRTLLPTTLEITSKLYCAWLYVRQSSFTLDSLQVPFFRFLSFLLGRSGFFSLDHSCFRHCGSPIWLFREVRFPLLPPDSALVHSSLLPYFLFRGSSLPSHITCHFALPPAARSCPLDLRRDHLYRIPFRNPNSFFRRERLVLSLCLPAKFPFSLARVRSMPLSWCANLFRTIFIAPGTRDPFPKSIIVVALWPITACLLSEQSAL